MSLRPLSTFVRFSVDGGPAEHGWLDGAVIHTPSTDIELDHVDLLPPCVPTKVICVGLNYRDHAEEVAMDVPEEPVVFLKPPSTVVGHRADIVKPLECDRLDYEGELGVVISRRARHVRREDASDVIAGFTVANDVTARDFQVPGSQWTKSKGYDTFAPVGPYLVRGVPPDELVVETRLNGEVRQRGSVTSMIFAIDELVSYISSIMTLERGDLIMTGTPPGVGPMEPGDHVAVVIEGVGMLENRVVATP